MTESEEDDLEFHDAPGGAKEVEYKGEIYGRIWESIAWSKEEAEAQRLSNILFMAAKEDIIADKIVAKASGIKYKSNLHQLKTEHVQTNEEIIFNESTKTETTKRNYS